MEELKLSASELRLMELLWDNDQVTAAELHRRAAAEIGWNKNTTYTILKKLVDKGAVERGDPVFVCRTLIAREAVQKTETRSLIDRLFSGSRKSFFAAFLEDETLSQADLDALKKLLEKK